MAFGPILAHFVAISGKKEFSNKNKAVSSVFIDLKTLCKISTTTTKNCTRFMRKRGYRWKRQMERGTSIISEDFLLQQGPTVPEKNSATDGRMKRRTGIISEDFLLHRGPTERKHWY